jgi:hypothetical protein
MHIFNPEVSKIGYIILVYYIGTGLLQIVTLMDEGMELHRIPCSQQFSGCLLIAQIGLHFKPIQFLKIFQNHLLD